METNVKNVDVELIKWLSANKKKIVFKFDENGGEIYVEDKK